jgi:hypothetical protein
MSRMYFAGLVGLLCAGLVFTLNGVQGGGKDKTGGGNYSETLKNNLETINQVELANSLIVYGRKAKQPAAYLLAAQILQQAKFRDASEAEFKGIMGDLKFESHPEPAKLVEMARAIDGAETKYAALFKETQQILVENQKYRKGGPIVGVTYLRATTEGPAGIFEHNFKGGEPAQVFCRTEGGGLMGVTVRDSLTGEAVAQTPGPTANVNLTWFVPVENRYKIFVFNHQQEEQRVSWSVP